MAKFTIVFDTDSENIKTFVDGNEVSPDCASVGCYSGTCYETGVPYKDYYFSMTFKQDENVSVNYNYSYSTRDKQLKSLSTEKSIASIIGEIIEDIKDPKIIEKLGKALAEKKAIKTFNLVERPQIINPHEVKYSVDFKQSDQK